MKMSIRKLCRRGCALLAALFIFFNVTVVPAQASDDWDGPVLNRVIGTVEGPSGKETYYNLNMTWIIEYMHEQGYEGEFWVRDDGVKMLGDYVMRAACFDVHPLGSLVETSLGTAIVCDTGTFIYDNPYQIDIAVRW